jgi:hypothetical protein
MKIVIYEATGDWAAALRREASPPLGIAETRSMDELLDALSQSSAAVAAIEISTSRVESGIAAVVRISRQFPRASIVALADRALGGFEPIIRESGVAHVIYSARRAAEIAAIAQKHLASMDENDFNAEEDNYEQQIFARLPWGS